MQRFYSPLVFLKVLNLPAACEGRVQSTAAAAAAEETPCVVGVKATGFSSGCRFHIKKGQKKLHVCFCRKDVWQRHCRLFCFGSKELLLKSRKLGKKKKKEKSESLCIETIHFDLHLKQK